MAFLGAGGIATLSKTQFDALINNVIQNLDGALLQAQQIQKFLTAHPDADFEAASGPGPTGYDAVAHPIATVKSAFGDLDELRKIYQGISSQSTLRGNSNAYDYTTFPKLIASLIH